MHRPDARAWALAGALASAALALTAGLSLDGAREFHATVVAVVDGDTIAAVIDGERTRVRLIGVDTPEIHPSSKLDRQVRGGWDRDRIQALGRRSAAFTRAQLLGRRVRLELDVEIHDRYGRLLAYVWLEDGTLFNATLLRHGYARLLTIPPNVRHADRLRGLEASARAARRGLWAHWPPVARK